MTASAFSNAMCEINEKYIIEALNYSKETSVPRFRFRLSVALIAALIALLLMGAGVAAVIYGDRIQNWFEHDWEISTDQPMSEGQTAVIDHLSQEIGLSETVNGVTVTVDSATVGDDLFYLLVGVEGVDFSERYGYDFETVDVEVSPDYLFETGGMGSVSAQYQGTDGDGAGLFLISWGYSSTDGYEPDASPLEVALLLKDFYEHTPSGQQKLLTDGQWRFSFMLDRSQPPEAIHLSDAEVIVPNLEGKEVAALFTDIELTNTGIRFCYERDTVSIALAGRNMVVIMENGAEVESGRGIGVPLDGSNIVSFSCQWKIPINLDEVVAIQFGETQIPVSLTTSP